MWGRGVFLEVMRSYPKGQGQVFGRCRFSRPTVNYKRWVMEIMHLKIIKGRGNWNLKLTRNKSIVPRRTMHTGRMSGHSTRRVLITMPIITMRSRLFPANSASDCLRFLNFRPQFCEFCGATYRRICDMFSALRSTSGRVTDVVNCVQIDA